MAYVNGTTHYNLPQTVGTDKRDWADTNEAFAAVDAALYGAVDDVAQAQTEIDALTGRMNTAEQNIATNTGNIAGLDTRLTTAEGAITSQQSQITDLRQDTEDMICAYNEASATSTHAYAVGDYFIYNDVLYRAIQAIAIGDTIVPDTNCTTTNITTELLAFDTSNFVNTDVVCLYTESSATASRNYAIGDYFILNDTLYVVTAAITSGDNITVGTNCNSVSVTSELIALKSRINNYSTAEKIIGMFNGKPLYSKTFINTSPATGVIPLGVAWGEIDNIVNVQGVAYRSDNQSAMPIPIYNSASAYIELSDFYFDHEVSGITVPQYNVLVTGYSVDKTIITIYYTKAAD